MEMQYSGPTHDGLRHGEGVLRMSGYITYEGTFIDGRRNGPGKLLFAGGADGYVEGSFIDGELVGSARRVWPDGRRFEGNLDNGEMSGHGVLANPDEVGSKPPCYSDLYRVPFPLLRNH